QPEHARHRREPAGANLDHAGGLAGPAHRPGAARPGGVFDLAPLNERHSSHSPPKPVPWGPAEVPAVAPSADQVSLSGTGGIAGASAGPQGTGLGSGCHDRQPTYSLYQSSTEPSSWSYSSRFFQSWPILSAIAFSSSSMPRPGPVGRSR